MLDVFLARESIGCDEDIEPAYYSALVDGTASAPLICYACGASLTLTRLEEYIETKKVWSQVRPTCGDRMCLKHRKKKIITSLARKADATWKNQSRLTKRLQVERARQEAQDAANDRNN